MDKVSVIVPIYNAEKYLENCIESLLRQTYENIEIVLVNDGSTDNSKKICEKYLANDSRIQLINTMNQGAGRARQIGVQKATGKKLCFLDSDDFMEPSCIEEMILMFEVNNADLVECAYYNYTKNRKKLHLFFGENVIFDRKKFINNVIKNTILDGKEAVVLWNKMYNRKIFERTIENYGSNLLEDYIINIQYYSAVNRYCYISKPLVNYRMVSGSLSRRYQSEVITKLNSEIIPLKKKYMEIYGFVHTEDIEANSNWYSNYVFNYLLMGTMLKNSLKTTKRAIQLIDLDELKASEKINKFSKIALKYSENIVSIYICFCGLFYRLKCKLYVLIRNKK